MIKSVTITNHLGESLTIDLRFPEQSGFLIRDIDGLGPSKADINKTELSVMDGSIYNSARVTSRNIVLDLGFQEYVDPFFGQIFVEKIRHDSYKYFPVKKRVEILIETDTRICKTYGYVESNDVNIFSDKEGAIVSIVCPDSYLYSLTKATTVFSSIISSFEFPFSNESLNQNLIVFANMEMHTTKTVYYEGDAAVGLVLYIHAIGAASDIEIQNTVTREKITIDSARLIALTGEDIHAGDDIIISTVKGDKYAILQRDGQEFNILNVLGKYPDWFQLEKGDNIFTYSADVGVINLQFRIENQIAYEGI